MLHYHHLLRRILDEGVKKEDRSGMGILCLCGYQACFKNLIFILLLVFFYSNTAIAQYYGTTKEPIKISNGGLEIDT
jgi:uncharacterized membrane protein